MKSKYLLLIVKLVFIFFFVIIIPSCEDLSALLEQMQQEFSQLYTEETVDGTGFIVTFNSMGGTKVEELNIEEEGLLSQPNDPSKEGYFCSGWYTDEEYAEEWNFENDIVDNNITLYAYWETEIFYDADRESPQRNYLTDSNGEHSYVLQKPWNYNKEYNSTRKYPLIISLHGSGPPENYFYYPCLNNDTEKQNYPSFFIGPYSPNDWGDGAYWVRDLIEILKTEYRIDANRIYIVGFSMGGSGSYLFAKSYYDEYPGSLIAGIVRLAGASQTDFESYEQISEATSIWYHSGDNDPYDYPGWDINGDQDNRKSFIAYNFIKNYSGNSTAIETISYDFTTHEGIDYPRTTWTLTKDDVQIFKLSHYEGMEHEGGPVRADNISILNWLFAQDLRNR